MNIHYWTTIFRPKSLSASILWGDFLSFYSQFYEVIILETYVIGEREMQNIFLDIELRL
jgi:hypothetical protein